MKILYYYWTQYDDNLPGGGVKVYLKNIINNFKQNENIEIYTLNSGSDYDLSSKLYYKCIKKKSKLKQFKIINSPVLAPSKYSFYEMEKYLKDTTLKTLLNEFIKENGPFDVIHIQSIEGLNIEVLKLKEEYPKTKFILSLHNYHYFCPQVNLWKNNTANCKDFEDGCACNGCLGNFPSSEKFKKLYLFNHYLEKYGFVSSFNKIRNVLKLAYMFFLKEKNEDNKLRNEYIDPKLFKEFREKNIKYINKYADRILCVSKRVKEIALEMGIEETKLDVCYIGTAFAKNARNNINSKVFGLKHFKIAYMGYMRKDKGLYFFVDALEQLDINISQNMEVIIAAKFEDNDLVNRIEHLKKRFANLKLLDGYTHKDIPQITENLSLGIVPVMWEDCLPQVAIEFKAMGIPVLSSDLGGASELTEAKEFCFRAGNLEDFLDHLIAVYENRDLLNTYYRKHLKLMTVEEHCKELMKYYK